MSDLIRIRAEMAEERDTFRFGLMAHAARLVREIVACRQCMADRFTWSDYYNWRIASDELAIVRDAIANG